MDLANNQIPAVTDQMVIAAPSRAAVVESSCAHMVLFYYLILADTYTLDWFIIYTPQNLLQALQQIDARLSDIGQHMRAGNAQNGNTRIISRNSRVISPLQFCPLQKTVILIVLFPSAYWTFSALRSQDTAEILRFLSSTPWTQPVSRISISNSLQAGMLTRSAPYLTLSMHN